MEGWSNVGIEGVGRERSRQRERLPLLVSDSNNDGRVATDTWLPKRPCPYCSILAGKREPLATLWGTSTCTCVYTNVR